MAPKKKAPPPVEEPPPAEEEEEKEESLPPEREKFTLLHLPRGPGRPVLGQVVSTLSEPHLREELRKTFGTFDRSLSEADLAKTHSRFRGTLQGELTHLAKQTKKRKQEAARLVQTEKFKEASRLGHLKFLKGTRLGEQKPAWTYCDAPNYFEQPLLEQGESLQCNKDPARCGIYNVQHPDFKPPHHEMNVYGGWTYFDTNIRNERLYEFKDKESQGSPMSPGEKMFKERLENSIKSMTDLAKTDAFDKTSGFVKKQLIEKNADEFSALKRTKPHWMAQQVSTHTYFQPPTLAGPPYDEYDCTLGPYIVDAERSQSHKKNIICIDPNANPKSFWNCPTKSMTGTNRRLVRSQELLHRNQRGCVGLTPEPASAKRHCLLKGTGTLCFTSNQDALLASLNRTVPALSPLDRSGPP